MEVVNLGKCFIAHWGGIRKFTNGTSQTQSRTEPFVKMAQFRKHYCTPIECIWEDRNTEALSLLRQKETKQNINQNYNDFWMFLPTELFNLFLCL